MFLAGVQIGIKLVHVVRKRAANVLHVVVLVYKLFHLNYTLTARIYIHAIKLLKLTGVHTLIYLGNYGFYVARINGARVNNGVRLVAVLAVYGNKCIKIRGIENVEHITWSTRCQNWHNPVVFECS